MKKVIREILRRNQIEAIIHGLSDYVQVIIEAGTDVHHSIIEEITEKTNTWYTISCVHTENLGYCLMVEFYK